MKKPEKQTKEFYDFMDVRDYVNSVEPGVGNKFDSIFFDQHTKGNDCATDFYFFIPDENLNEDQKTMRRVAEIMDWETDGELEITFWVSW